ncbi:MAG TPA: DUF6350 family protein [Marmoricola sp.]|nr:DUF6350 family protein [Marmoricola sp.]
MTDLLGRPTTRRATDTSASTGVQAARPLPVSAALAGAAAAGSTLVVCLALALTGWFLADAGAHGQTTDALRVGADAWLLGHGAALTVAGSPVGIVPLGLSLVLAVACFRAGRWAGSSSQPVSDDRSLAVGVVTATAVHVVVAVVTAILAADPGVTGLGLGRATAGAVLLSLVAGGLGQAVGTGRLHAWLSRCPGSLRGALDGALRSAGLLLLAAGVLVLGMLVAGWGEAASVMSRLHLDVGDGLMYLLVNVTVLPNAVLLGVAWLLGPGFAIGTGTVVSTSAVALGPVPAFPLLAALPGEGTPPGWLAGSVAVPVLAAAIGAALAQQRRPTTAWDSGLLRGFGSGLGAAVVVSVLVALAGGPMGTGRMADIGAPEAQVAISALATLGGGGLLGGAVTTWWQRRAARRAD